MTCDGLASRPGEVEILLAASCYRNRDTAPAAMGQLALTLHFTLFVKIFHRIFLEKLMTKISILQFSLAYHPLKGTGGHGTGLRKHFFWYVSLMNRRENKAMYVCMVYRFFLDK